MFYLQLTLLREIFQKNGYPKNLIDACFKLLLNRIQILKEKILTDEKTSLRLLDPCKLILNCKSPSKGYLTVVNYGLF